MEAGLPVAELCRQHGFSGSCYYLWGSKFGGMGISDAKRLKKLEAENTRLKRLLAETSLENEVTKEAVQKSGERPVPPRTGELPDWHHQPAACQGHH